MKSGQLLAEVARVYTSSRQLLREVGELRRRLAEWESLGRTSLQPYLDRSGNLELVQLHAGLARVASLALQYGVPHQRLLDAVKPDPRGVTAPPSAGGCPGGDW